MNDLIATLKSQHRAVQTEASNLAKAIEARDAGRIRNHLDILTKALTNHLSLEDKELYPPLTRAAQEHRDEVLGRTAAAFTDSMGRITAQLKRFLERHGPASGPLDLPSFTKDWETILGLLVSRIEAEERALYPLYERWTVEAPPRPQVKASRPPHGRS